MPKTARTASGQDRLRTAWGPLGEQDRLGIFIEILQISIEFYRIIQNSTDVQEFYMILKNSSEFYRILQKFICLGAEPLEDR